MVLNSLSFCLSVKVLLSLSNLNEILARWSNLGYRFFPFITLNMSCYSLLPCRFSAERSAVNLMGIPLYVICCFYVAAFNIFSLYLIFDSLIDMCLVMFLLGFILYGLNALSTLFSTSSQLCTILICVLKMRKLRLREVELKL